MSRRKWTIEHEWKPGHVRFLHSMKGSMQVMDRHLHNVCNQLLTTRRQLYEHEQERRRVAKTMRELESDAPHAFYGVSFVLKEQCMDTLTLGILRIGTYEMAHIESKTKCMSHFVCQLNFVFLQCGA